MSVVDDTLFVSLDPPILAGSRCTDCDAVAFPAQSSCARCTGSNVGVVPLADHGALWTFTTQAFAPKPPYREPDGGFVPFGVGYVDLGDVIVEGRLVGDPDQLAIGDPMQLVLLSVPTGITYAFERAS